MSDAQLETAPVESIALTKATIRAAHKLDLTNRTLSAVIGLRSLPSLG